MSFEPTFTLLPLQHGQSKRKQYKCNLCAKDFNFSKHTTISVSDGYWNLKRHINLKHSEEKENFEEMCEKSRINNYEAGMKKLLPLRQNSLKHQTQKEYQKHQVYEVKQETINVNRNTHLNVHFLSSTWNLDRN